MPVPKRKASKSRRNSRKSANQVVTASSFMDCSNCNSTVVPHQVCKNCGFYGGKKVMETKLDRAMRRSTKTKATEAAQPLTAQVESETTKAAAPKRPSVKRAPKA